MGRKILVLLVLLLLPVPGLARARVVLALHEATGELNPGPALEILEDRGGALTIEDVLSPALAERWRPVATEHVNLGFTDAVHWLRFSAADRSTDGIWYLELNNPHMDYVQFFQRRGGEIRISRTGDQLPFMSREVKHRAFLFRMFTGPEGADYVLRVHTHGAATVPLTIRSAVNVSDHLDREQFILGLFYGIMCIMIVYNVSLFFFVRARLYLYYVLYIISTTTLYLAWNGLFFQYIWPERGWANFIVPVLMVGANVMSLQFARFFLELPRMAPRWNRWMKGLMWAGLPVLPFALFTLFPYMNYMIAVYSSLNLASLITVGILMLLRGSRAARFYVLAFGAVLVGGLLAVLRVTGLVEASFFALWSNQIGSVVEVALLSLALGDRINLIRAQREAARAEALENRRRADILKDQFLSNISHELRTPLAEVYGYAEILVDEKDGVREDLRPMTTAIHRASARLSELIQDLMLLSSLDNDLATDIHPVVLRDLLEECLVEIQPMIAERGIAIVRREDASLRVEGDAGLLAKACYHILKNAVLYNREGGLVEVEVGPGDAGQARIIVRDTGIGLRAHDLNHIFDKFYRVDSSLTYTVQGVGLGLFMARRILELHGGRVAVESTPGEGSVFTIELPQAHSRSHNI